MSQKKPLISRIVSVKNIYMTVAIFSIVIALMLLNFTGYLDKVHIVLSAAPFAFQIGSFTTSVYAIIKGIFVFMVLLWLARIVVSFGEARISKFQTLRPSSKSLIIKAFQIITYFVIFLVTLDAVGIDLLALTVLGGAVGIGIGFGLQKITSNFISGIILLFEKSIEADDLVEIKDGVYGVVKYTAARYTLVETLDGKEILIPNEDLVVNQVINWTHSNNHGRIDVMIGVSYGSDIIKARDVILKAVRDNKDCMNTPEPACYLDEFADSSVNFRLLFWVDDVSIGRFKIKNDVLFAIWKGFKDNNIEIPFPQRDVHIKNTDLLRKAIDE